MADASTQEPSMEDILASIRRILSEEETQEQAAPPPAPAAALPAPKVQEWSQQTKTDAPGGQAKEWGNKQAAEAVGGKTEAWTEKPVEAPGAAKEAWHDKPADAAGGQQGMMNKPAEGPGGRQEAWTEKPLEAPGATKESWQDKPEGAGGRQEAWAEKPLDAPGGKQEEWHDRPVAGQGKSWDEQEQRRRAPAAEAEDDVLVLTEDMLAEDDLELADVGPGGMRNMNPMDEGDGMPAGTSALAQLKRVVAQRSQSMASDRNLALGNGGVTIEQLVREILNDLLRDWINQHLPPMVDRIAKREIQKLVSGAE